MDENSLYNRLGSKINLKPKSENFKDKRLRDVLDKNLVLSTMVAQQLFVNELKFLLKIESLYQLIFEIKELENYFKEEGDKLELLQLHEEWVQSFYQTLSPIILRSILENTQSMDKPEVLQNCLKESIRIAIEDLIFNVELKHE